MLDGRGDGFDNTSAELIGTYVGMVAPPGGVDDTAVVQAAINAAAAANGGRVMLAAGTYVCTTLTLYRGVHLVGAGIGGDIFSDTDAGFPFRGTAIKLKASTNADLIKTENFASLTGTSPSTYDVPLRFGLHHLVLDGNSFANASGICLRIYGRSYVIEDVIVQNGKDGGVYSEYTTGGYEMEAQWSNFRIMNCGGIGLEWRGPHDSQFVNGIVGHGASGATYGVKIVAGANVGGEQFTNVHAWGTYSSAPWELGGNDGQFLNCYSDGGGIALLASGNNWDGFILGTNTPGQYAVKLGDGTTRSLGQNRVRGRVKGFKASPFAVQTLNTTSLGNRYEAIASLGGITRYASLGNVYTTTGAVAAGAATIPMSATTDLPASGTLYADDGTNRTAALAYTGKTSNSLTGVTGVPAGGLASGAALWLVSTLFGATDFGSDSFELWDYDALTGGGLHLRRPTPNSQSDHSAIETFTSFVYAQEGLILTKAGVQGGRLYGGSGAPAFAALAGDRYQRTDTPTTPAQREYICTGGSTWVDALTISEAQVTNLVADLAAKSATGHAHVESDVTSLVADLAAKETPAGSAAAAASAVSTHNALVTAHAALPFQLPYKTGKDAYSFPQMNQSLGTSNGNGNGTLRLAPCLVRNAITISRVGAEVTVVGEAGSKLRLGLYADDGAGYPGALIQDFGTIAGDSATVQEITLGTPLAITPGLYWLGAANQLAPTTQPTVRVINGTIPGLLLQSIPAAGGIVSGYAMTGQTGALTGPFTTTVALSNVTPRLFWRVT